MKEELRLAKKEIADLKDRLGKAEDEVFRLRDLYSTKALEFFEREGMFFWI